MATWSGIRKKLETEYLAQSLQGHIQYYVTSYSKSPDHEGRAAIRYDGKEIIKGCYWNNWSKAGMFPQDEKYEKRIKVENAYIHSGIVTSRIRRLWDFSGHLEIIYASG